MIAKIINNKKVTVNSNRVDGKFFLNQDSLDSAVLEDNKDKCVPLLKIASVFNPPVFKRQFCKKTNRSVMYFQSSDVPALSEYSSVFINKKQAESLNTLVHENQILVTGFGTVGNVRLVSKLQENVCYANNVCRIVAKDNNLYGYVYAFMASKYARAQLNKNASGSVVRYIEAPGIKTTLIPIFSESKQQEIHNLVIESANLRVKANRLLEEATNIFDKLLDNEDKDRCKTISISNIKNRFDAFSNLENYKIDAVIMEHAIGWISIKSISDKIFIGPRSKRNYVSKGTPFLSGSELQKANPIKVEKFLNHKDAIPFVINKDWILITRSGTIGSVSYVLPVLDGYAATDDAIRIITKLGSKVTAKYLYAFLSSEFGKRCVQKDIFGSVIQHINEEQIGNVLIPIIETKSIEEKIDKYCTLLNESIIKENQAIQLVEKEIESWQQS